MLKEIILYPANAAEQPPSTRLPVLFCQEDLKRFSVTKVSIRLHEPEENTSGEFDSNPLLHVYPIEYFEKASMIPDDRLSLVYRERNTGELCTKDYSLDNIRTVCFLRHLPKRPPADPSIHARPNI